MAAVVAKTNPAKSARPYQLKDSEKTIRDRTAAKAAEQKDECSEKMCWDRTVELAAVCRDQCSEKTCWDHIGAAVAQPRGRARYLY